MNTQALRIFVFRIHTWLGLNTCILLAVMFATGTVLVFSSEIETAFYAKTSSGDMPQGQPLSFGQIFDAVQNAYPDVQIASIRRSGTGAIFGDSVQVRPAWGEKLTIWVDPGTGEILGASPSEGVRYMLLAFHDSLFTGKWFGRYAVTILAFSLLVSVITGLLAYRRFWRGLKTLPPRGRGPRPWWGALHRLVAVWSLPFLLVVAITGIYYFVAVTGIIPAKGPRIPPASERAGALPAGFDGAALDAAIAAARNAAPDQNISTIILPGNPNQGIAIYGPSGPSIIKIDTNQVIVDPATMTVMAHITPADFSPKNKAKHFFDSMHHGDWAGNYSRTAWLIFGMAGTLLMISGAMVFASRVARMRQPGGTGPRTGSAPRRVWRGMFMAKWALVPLAVAVAGIGFYRFAWIESRWTTVDPTSPATLPAKLAVKGDLRQGQPLPVRLRLDGTAAQTVQTAEVRLDGSAAENVSLTGSKQARVADFMLTPGAGRNVVSVSVYAGSGEPEVLTWTLGRPIR